VPSDGHVAARGGSDAIRAAKALVRAARDGAPSAPLALDQIGGRLRLAVDRVVGEGGLWAPELEQSILLTTDGLDASGFLEHLKLPHYVTFRSMVDCTMVAWRGGDARARRRVPRGVHLADDRTDGR